MGTPPSCLCEWTTSRETDAIKAGKVQYVRLRLELGHRCLKIIALTMRVDRIGSKPSWPA